MEAEPKAVVVVPPHRLCSMQWLVIVFHYLEARLASTIFVCVILEIFFQSRDVKLIFRLLLRLRLINDAALSFQHFILCNTNCQYILFSSFDLI